MKKKEKEKLLALVKTLLPETHSLLKSLYKGEFSAEKCEQTLRQTILELADFFNQTFENKISFGTADQLHSAELGSGDSLDDPEAVDLLETMDKPITSAMDEHSDDSLDDMSEQMSEETSEQISEQMADSDDDAKAMLTNIEEAEASVGDMSDEEAQALLADMDAPAQSEEGDMSDDEAKALLADMDAPAQSPEGDMSDAEAQALLADMDAPAKSAEEGDMSDAEAQALLADMDAPAQSPQGDMSDDEAQKLLADMDSPAESSSNSEEEDLLAQLGGADENDPPPSTAQPQTAEENDSLESEEEVGEVEEFSGSEFASDPDMMNDFIMNADELMESLDEQILALESDPSSKEVIEEIFRAAHTLKGAAGMFGFISIERIMHRMENYFDLIRKGKMTANGDAVDLVLEAMDILKILVEAVKNNQPSGYKTAPIIVKLNALCAGKYTKDAVQPPPSDASSDSTAQTPEPHTPQGAEGQNVETKPKAAPKKDQSTIRVDLTRLDMLVNLIGELVIDRTRFMNIEEVLRAEFSEIDLTTNMSETVQLFGRHMNQIQDIIMKVRMVPIGNAFNKFNRIVRDIARQLDKEIDLMVFGEDTELDKTLVEQIGDPLVHLIRNACDHGAETMEQRKAAGKRGPATIELSARQEGNHILITIQDDGKGIDPEIIRKKGQEKGLISEQDVLTDKEIFSLIFEPGFSTAAEVTNISGRGVGMDVVKKQISKLKGLIDIDSAKGKGTTITIQLPLTLAIVQSLLVKSAGDIFAIPLSTVVESLRIAPDEIQKVGDTEIIKRRDKMLPLIYLDKALELSKKENDFWFDENENSKEGFTNQRQEDKKKGRLFVVVVGSGDKRFGIVVDHLLNQQEMVIKPMGNIMREIPCVAGGAILGNGKVVLVLEIQEIEQMMKGKHKSVKSAA